MAALSRHLWRLKGLRIFCTKWGKRAQTFSGNTFIKALGVRAVPNITEEEAELLIEEHLRERGWNITDFTLTRKRWRQNLDGEVADRVFLHEGVVVAILEAKKPGKDLWAALDQAKRYART